MKTDKELLELAAKAAGYGCFEGHAKQMIESGWNPLTDDGDALRLAVKLRFKIDIRAVYINVEPYVFNEDANSTTEYFGDNESERSIATRRAIVRAAAAIGESK